MIFPERAFGSSVSLRGGQEGSPEMMAELREHVARKIGKIARPGTASRRSRSRARSSTIPRVAEAAVCGRKDEATGQAIVALRSIAPATAA